MRKKLCRMFSFILVILLICNQMVMASPPEKNNPLLGQEGYVALSNYIQATDDPEIYKVTLGVNSFFEKQPLYVSIVMDETASMYHEATKDPQYTLPDGSPAFYSRWQMQKKQYIDLINILSDPVKNPSYQQTYVAVLANSGSYNGRIRTANESAGQADPQLNDYDMGMIGYATLKQLTPTKIDTTTQVPTFTDNELYFKNTDLATYESRWNWASQVNSGFVKVSESKDKLLNLLPEYPYMSTALASASAGYAIGPWGDYQMGVIQPCLPGSFGLGWIYTAFNDFGSRATQSFEDSRYLMEMTWDTSNPDAIQNPENAKRVTVLFSDNLEDDYGPRIQQNVELQKAAAILKAPRSYSDISISGSTVKGVSSEIWTVGVGFNFYEPSVFPTPGRDDFSNYQRFQNGNGGTLQYGKLEHRNDWGTHFFSWAANSPLVDDPANPGTNNFPYPVSTNVPALVASPSDGTVMTWINDCTNVWDYCSQFMEPHLVALSLPTQNETDYTNFFPPISSLDNIEYQQIFSFYSKYGLKDENGKAITRYDYIESVNDTVPMFNNMPARYYTDTPIVAKMNLANEFELVQYQGNPLLAVSGGPLAGSATSNGRAITWTLGNIPTDNETYALTFYIKVNSSMMQSGLYYDIFSEPAYIEYGRFGLKSLNENPIKEFDVVKYFPSAFINGDLKAIKNNISNAVIGMNDISEEQSGTISVANGILGNSISSSDLGGQLVLDATIPKYTASVTMTPRKTPSPTMTNLVDETVDDGTAEKVVQTGTIGMIAGLFVIALGGTAIFIQYRKRNH